MGVVSFNRGQLTKRCIDSLRQHTACRYQIFLADNASDDEQTLELLALWEQHDDIRVLRLDKNHGPSYARNRILELIGDDFPYVAMFDNDMAALPGWDQAALEAFSRGADLIQPKLLKADQETVDRGPNFENPCSTAANPAYIGRGSHRLSEEVIHESDVAIVGAGIFRKSMFDALGGYDEAVSEGEDYDLSFRAKAAGLSLKYIPQCELIHDHPFDLEYDNVRQGLLKKLRSHIVVWRKHKKAILSPRYLHWYAWLHKNEQSMYLQPDEPEITALAKLSRSLHFRWYQYRYGSNWPNEKLADRETERLAGKLGI